MCGWVPSGRQSQDTHSDPPLRNSTHWRPAELLVEDVVSATTRSVLRLDLPTGTLELDDRVAERLRDAAAAMAGRSSAARDLSIVLDRALSTGRAVALRRAEHQTLREVAETAGISDLVEPRS